MSVEHEPGRLTCRVCGATWAADDTTAALLEELEAHAETHLSPGETPDRVHPRIWLR